MSGFNAAFVRIPANTDPEAFAEAIAEKFFSLPLARKFCRVQYALGFQWLHLDGFSNDGDSLTDTTIHPALRPLESETISLAAHAGSSTYFYRHHAREHCLRALYCTEGRVLQNSGDEELWEAVRRKVLVSKHGSDSGWPAEFDANDVIEAFGLPSPWSTGAPDFWELDYSWED